MAISLIGAGSAGAGLVEAVEEGSGGLDGLGREVGWQDDSDLDVQVAKPAGIEAGHALAAQPERSPGLGARWDFQQDVALQGLDPDLGTEESFLQRQRKVVLQIGPATSESSIG